LVEQDVVGHPVDAEVHPEAQLAEALCTRVGWNLPLAMLISIGLMTASCSTSASASSRNRDRAVSVGVCSGNP
ncbi:MAG: hypothetical protein ABEH59_00520, partial [Halobacteriales archaeon]